MVQIAPVGLQYNPKTLWFDAGDLSLTPGDKLIVQTERGLELGTLVEDTFSATPEELEELNSPLKPVVRKASEDDLARGSELEQKSKDAMPIFRAMAAQSNEDMSPVAVEYLFSEDKAVFYFSAEDRVDFRELVRKLAAHFHVRIDMRQIGVRDEARIIGGLGHCGQELCCKRMGGEFQPVSIRMAKEQDLSLNPVKISGVCGRLMCCLRYEFETYKECKCRCPKMGASIDTPCGCAKVCEINVPKELISLRTEEGKLVKVPLEDMDAPSPGERPTAVGEEAFQRALDSELPDNPSTQGEFETSLFTGTDTLVDYESQPGQVNKRRRAQDEQAEGEGKSRRRRRNRRSATVADDESGEKRSNRSARTKQSSRGGNSASERSKKSDDKQKDTGRSGSTRNRRGRSGQNKTQEESVQTAARPGQNSSSLKRSQGSEGQEVQHRKSRRPRRKIDASGASSNPRSAEDHSTHEAQATKPRPDAGKPRSAEGKGSQNQTRRSPRRRRSVIDASRPQDKDA